jgi:hypothetical protein
MSVSTAEIFRSVGSGDRTISMSRGSAAPASQSARRVWPVLFPDSESVDEEDRFDAAIWEEVEQRNSRLWEFIGTTEEFLPETDSATRESVRSQITGLFNQSLSLSNNTFDFSMICEEGNVRFWDLMSSKVRGASDVIVFASFYHNVSFTWSLVSRNISANI